MDDVQIIQLQNRNVTSISCFSFKLKHKNFVGLFLRSYFVGFKINSTDSNQLCGNSARMRLFNIVIALVR